MSKPIIAVLFGGPAVEHDISILTGLQIIEAMDTTKYLPLPIYVDQQGSWWHGAELLNRKNYHFSEKLKTKLTKIELPIGQIFNKRPFFQLSKKSMFTKAKPLYFDLAFMAFHGEVGEDGMLQGVFETAKIPYTGVRPLAAAIYMNKVLAKKLFKSVGIPVLPEVVLTKPKSEALFAIEQITASLAVTFPLCAKPCNLGSSIGVYKVSNQEELNAAILAIFKLDNAVMLEPFVDNLIEYNIAVSKALDGNITFSAIEKPLKDGLFLSFKDKYLAHGSVDNKLSSSLTEGMVSATRVLNPQDLTVEQKKLILHSAEQAFAVVAGCGAPRIDFLCNSSTGELWLNEVNPLPGSLGYFLWEARTPKVGFTRLIEALIQEGFMEQQKIRKSLNLATTNSAIFPVKA